MRIVHCQVELTTPRLLVCGPLHRMPGSSALNQGTMLLNSLGAEHLIRAGIAPQESFLRRCSVSFHAGDHPEGADAHSHARHYDGGRHQP